MVNPAFSDDCYANQFNWEYVVQPFTKADVEDWIKAIQSDKYILGAGTLRYSLDETICHCVLGVVAEERGLLSYFTGSKYSYFAIDGLEGSSSTLSCANTYFMPSILQKHIFEFNDTLFFNKEPANYHVKIQLVNFIKEVFGYE